MVISNSFGTGAGKAMIERSRTPATAIDALERISARSRAFAGNAEPALDELLDDPVLAHMLAADGIPLVALKEVIADAQARLRAA